MIRNRTGFYLSCISSISFLLVVLFSDRFDRMPTNLPGILEFVGFYLLMLSAVLSALSLLGIMFFDFFEYRKNISLTHQLSILLLLLGLNWIGSILYFIFIYYPRHKTESGSTKL